MQQALGEIREEMEQRVAYFKANDKLIEAQRIMERTNYDMEMLTEIGFCKGIENYSRVLSGRAPGQLPVYPARLLPGGFSAVCGRVARHPAAGERNVRRRPGAQKKSGGLRLPPAVRL